MRVPRLAQAFVSQSQRDQRTYYLSDERMRAFAQLTPLQRLQWVEQCSQFVRLGQLALQTGQASEQGEGPGA